MPRTSSSLLWASMMSETRGIQTCRRRPVKLRRSLEWVPVQHHATSPCRAQCHLTCRPIPLATGHLSIWQTPTSALTSLEYSGSSLGW